jgi:ABC-type multidrug transport system fused ATPase/permease subunit
VPEHPGWAGDRQVGGDVLAPVLAVRQVFGLFWPYTRGYRLPLAAGTLLIALSVPVEAAAIWLFKVLVDQVLTPRDFTAFPALAAAYIGLSLLTGVVSYVARQLLTRADESFVLALRTRVLDHLQTLSLDFFERRKLGDLLSRLGADVASIESLVLTGLSDAVGAGLQAVAFAAMMLVVDPLLAAGALAVSPLFWLIGRRFARRLKVASREARHRIGSLSSIAEESLANIAAIQAYNRQHATTERFRAEGEAVVRLALTSSRLQGVFAPLVELVELLGLMVVIGVGTWRLSTGALTLGGLLVFMAYFAQLYSPLRELGQLGTSASAAGAGAERIAEVLAARPSVPEDPRPWPVGRAEGTVEFRGVSFGYPGAERPAVQDVSFTASRGDLVAVVGRSGSGKSTLAKLLLRFYDPTSGAVLLDGHDVRDRGLRDLRDQIGIVLQETSMLDGTLLENILWGSPDAGPLQVDRAVLASDCVSVAADLPLGLDTPVGQRGRLLSGGQLQRVAIARAMIRDAPVLVLDEPATGLDPAAERRVLGPLRSLMTGRTTILISHNLLATRDADLILVLDDGRVVERGTFQQLLDRRGVFFQLHRAQTADRHSDDDQWPAPVVAAAG